MKWGADPWFTHILEWLATFYRICTIGHKTVSVVSVCVSGLARRSWGTHILNRGIDPTQVSRALEVKIFCFLKWRFKRLFMGVP